MGNNQPQTIAVIPAAGRATRAGRLPCSKEVYPLGLVKSSREAFLRPMPVCQVLLERLGAAGIGHAFFVLREGKWDIPAWIGDGSSVGLSVAYLVVRDSPSVPSTLDHAYAFVRGATVALGFPDIVFESADGFSLLLDRLRVDRADVAIGLFPADRPEKIDMVEMSEGPWVRRIVVKPSQTTLNDSWGIAVWQPRFTDFMHEYVAAQTTDTGEGELSVGHVIQAAIDGGMRVLGVRVSDRPFLDVGTPDDLARAVQRFSNLGETTAV